MRVFDIDKNHDSFFVQSPFTPSGKHEQASPLNDDQTPLIENNSSSEEKHPNC